MELGCAVSLWGDLAEEVSQDWLRKQLPEKRVFSSTSHKAWVWDDKEQYDFQRSESKRLDYNGMNVTQYSLRKEKQ